MRITLDLDKKKELKPCIIKINTVFWKGVIDELWLSSSGKGYHIIIYGINISFKQCLIMRRILGDDKRRVYIDRLRDKLGHATQVLFTSKGGKRAKKLYDNSTNLNLLPKNIKCIV